MVSTREKPGLARISRGHESSVYVMLKNLSRGAGHELPGCRCFAARKTRNMSLEFASGGRVVTT